MKQTYITVDFDGTIVTNMFPAIGTAVPGAIDWIRKYRRYGATLILLTMRSDCQKHPTLLQDAVNYCNSYDLGFKYVNENPEITWSNSPKIFGHQVIDDHNAGCPLIYPAQISLTACKLMGVKPYVDWEKVGPEVERYLKYRGHVLD